MTLKKYIPISFTIACIAAVLQCIDQALGQAADLGHCPRLATKRENFEAIREHV